MLKQVVLPAPFGPISASISPAARSKLTSSTAFTPPNDLREILRTDSRLTARTFSADAGCAQLSRERRRQMPSGNTSTSTRMMAPSSARQ